jgi:hypothetical protein
MLAGPTSPLSVMCRAVARTCNTLEVAAKVDLDRSDEDRAFFAAESEKLKPMRSALITKFRAIQDHELGIGDLNQSAVRLGDEVLDRGVRAGNTRTKLGLKGKSGLGADHAFGNRVDDLTEAPHRQEPGLVREALTRLEDLPDFEDKPKVKADLLARIDLQEKLLADRDASDAAHAKLESEAVKLVVDAALLLAQTKAALDGRFPRQRTYVSRFFLDVSPRRRRNDGDDDGTRGESGA